MTQAIQTLRIKKHFAEKILGVLLMLLLLAQVWFGMPAETHLIFAWALMATLCWHMLFNRQYLILDQGRNRLSHINSSLYPVRRQDIKLSSISAFTVSRSRMQRGRYTLYVVLKADAQLDITSGSLRQVEEIAQQLSKMTGLPLEQD
ncbi:hypothetical protein L2725_08710 [Shewanella corallii]|uniref:DUF304 domain-containing protein n=1 Tax=Shewanella corallii TaxID=560080 RepID=A0ABT0N606_9GAMM|nr:hypothetical protein [Shewanella corallii]MCL2913873.1 hypothetical protein [Shewanella corallii]